MSVPKVSDAELQQATALHLKNVQHNIERRLKVAQEQGNEELVRLLQAEMAQVSAAAEQAPREQPFAEFDLPI